MRVKYTRKSLSRGPAESSSSVGGAAILALKLSLRRGSAADGARQTDVLDPAADPAAVVPLQLEFERDGGPHLGVAGVYKHLRPKITIALSSSHLPSGKRGLREPKPNPGLELSGRRDAAKFLNTVSHPGTLGACPPLHS